jgi:hypothetical protein
VIAAGCYDGVTRLYDEASSRHLASLIAVDGEGDDADWIALTPEGYAAGSDRLLSAARWRQGGQEIAAARVWETLRRPESVAKALRGEAVGDVKFDKK